jgi:hypothetical protein
VNRVPVHVCIGRGRAPVRALTARLTAARPGWAVLELLSCPCCTGRAELQVRLAQLLRKRRPDRVLIGFVEPSHQAALERVLASWPLAQYIVPARALSVPEDAELTAEMLEGS